MNLPNHNTANAVPSVVAPARTSGPHSHLSRIVYAGGTWLALLCVLSAFAIGGCHSQQQLQDGDALTGKLTITGSSTVAPLVAEIAKRFEQLHPNVRIDVQAGGSGKGITDTRLGVSDLGMASRSLKADEADLTAHQIAADGVGLIVHKTNTIETLSKNQVTAIYSDKVNSWADLGGVQENVTVIHKAEGRATLEVFLKYFSIDNTTVKADVIVGDNEHGVQTVAGNQGAIGYVSIGTAEADIKQSVPIRLLPLDGVEANTSNVANGSFPMSRPLNLVSDATPSVLAIEFIRFCQSPEVHDVIKAQYFVPAGTASDVSQ